MDFKVRLELMSDNELDAEVVRLRQELAKYDELYAKAREEWAATGQYVVPSEEQLEASVQARTRLGMVEHTIRRKVCLERTKALGASPIDWPFDEPEVQAATACPHCRGTGHRAEHHGTDEAEEFPCRRCNGSGVLM